jgi:hypothetical protein
MTNTEILRGRSRFPGRISRCSRRGRHNGMPTYEAFAAGPAAERLRSTRRVGHIDRLIENVLPGRVMLESLKASGVANRGGLKGSAGNAAPWPKGAKRESNDSETGLVRRWGARSPREATL